ncbi:MAG: glycosyltransferase family 4 protein [Vulcanimicrobiota bacterium]
MKVLFICQTYPPDPGGLARAGERISTQLASHCASLQRLILDPRLAPAQSIYEPGLTRLGPLPDKDETLQLVEQMVAHYPDLDLVHAFYAGGLAAAAVAGARRAGVPSLISLRGNDLDRGLYRAPWLSWLIQSAGAISCVSREQKHKLTRWFGREDAVYIPNSVDPTLFYPEHVAKAEKPMVLFSGEMRWKKGLPLVLELAAQAEDRFEIVLAGGARGQERRLLRQQAPQVRLLDYAHDPAQLRRLYNQAALVWLPAFWEGMPNAVLEAMACARPVLANEVGGVADLVTEERGWPLPLNQTHLQLERMLEIIESPGQRGERARQFVLEHHRPEQETASYLELYRRCLDSGSAFFR